MSGPQKKKTSKATLERTMRRQRARAARSEMIQQKRERAWFMGGRRVAWMDDLNPEVEDFVDLMQARGQLKVLGSEPAAELDLRRVDKAARVRAMLDLLPPESAELLRERFVERLDIGEMAARRGVRYQSVQDRLQTACQDFVKVCADHWADDIDITLEDF